MILNRLDIDKIFYYWLLTSFVLIFIMIVVGGLTRLTDSGLSITEWELFSGILPPLTEKNGTIILIYIKKFPSLNF